MPEGRKNSVMRGLIAFGTFLGTLLAGQAHAAAPVPSVPMVSCTTNSSIFNTGIAGDVNDNSSFNLSTPKIPTSTASRLYYDLHWQKGVVVGSKTATYPAGWGEPGRWPSTGTAGSCPPPPGEPTRP